MTPIDSLFTLARLYRYRLGYSLNGLAAKLLAGVYFAAPREAMQDEIALLQRKVTIRAHTARKRAEAIAIEYLEARKVE